MLIRLLLAGAVALGATAPLAAKERPSTAPVRGKTSCIGSRCAVYLNGYRVGSYKYEEGRITIRDKRNRVIGRVSYER